ncbi:MULTISPECIES: hypothetical protein [Bacillus]|uniref:hypothetical protein n=1 Tax=Bacillus TaxID=1386 RepID=UPI0003308D19|nr:hypothetical protein [Bacillus cereus group sp. N17]EOP29450.1 hypothetical protein IIS_05126 [Bacillus cereus VD131]MBJ8042457.1 hypothetical protein [Bacillus cereus group sp. N17]
MIKPIQVVMYTHVITGEQATEGYSIKAQKDLLNTYTEKHNLAIISRYLDEGKSKE